MSRFGVKVLTVPTWLPEMDSDPKDDSLIVPTVPQELQPQAWYH